MKSVLRTSLCTAVLVVITFVASSVAQAGPPNGLEPTAVNSEGSEEVAKAIGVTSLLSDLRTLQSERACGSPMSSAEVVLRQEIGEVVLSASFGIDGVLAEIMNERTGLSELRATLQGRRDRTASLISAANLITGTGLGIAVNAMQFSTSTANLGDGIGVGSGIASTVLSIVAIRKQHGPQRGLGSVPNMLAPFFNVKPVLNTYYPPEVLQYLHSVPSGENPMRGTRLEQLMSDWVRSGRLDAVDSQRRRQKIAALTTSTNESVKLSIDDLTDRSAMLGEVSGRVALMKRDLSKLVRFQGERTCHANDEERMKREGPACR